MAKKKMENEISRLKSELTKLVGENPNEASREEREAAEIKNKEFYLIGTDTVKMESLYDADIAPEEILASDVSNYPGSKGGRQFQNGGRRTEYGLYKTAHKKDRTV